MDGSPTQDLTAPVMRRWVRAALGVAETTRALVDSLNVFPVPDADTGTNVTLTLRSAVDALALLPAGADLAQTTRAVADGAVRGARGNSGLLVSQALAALADVCAELPDPARLRPVELVHAYERMATTTWDAVSRPVTGTLLTVAQDAAAGARRTLEDATAREPVTLSAVAASAAFSAQESVVETAGLGHGPVDAGGAALMLLLTALSDTIDHPVVAAPEVPGSPGVSLGPGPMPYTGVAHQMLADLASAGAHGRPGEEEDVSTGEFEVMYLLEATAAQAAALRADLERIGDSVGVVGTPDALGVGLFQVHVHTDTPRAALPREGRARQVCIHHLHPTALALTSPWEADEPPVPGSRDDRVVSFESLAARRAQRLAAQRQEARRQHPSSSGAVAADPAAGTGVIACTRAPGLIEQLARTGAVVVLGPERDGIVRAVGDLGTSQAVVMPCDGDALGAAHEAARFLAARSAAGSVRGVGQTRATGADHDADAVQLLVCDTDDEARVLAAAVAIAGQGPTTEPAALLRRASRAAVAVRSVALAGTEAEPEAAAAALAAALRPDDELVTVILGRGADPDVGALVRSGAARRAEQLLGDADAVEVVLHAGGQESPDVLLALE